nr:hypothetical protein [Candidatus Aenigmarchaeota archaeon]
MKNLIYYLCVYIISVVIALSVSDAYAGLKIYEKDEVSLELYGRIQPRFEWKEKDDSTDTDSGKDFYIRRTRLGVQA